MSPPTVDQTLDAAAAQPRGKMLFRTLLGVLVGLGVAGAAAWYFGAKPSEVARYVAGVPAWAVVLCAASGFVNFALQSLRWHAVMGPLLGLRYGQAYRAQVVGYMFNALIPVRGGDLLRVQYLGRRTGKSRATILATEIVDRWLDLWGWIQGILLLALVADLPSWIFRAVKVIGVCLGVAALTMFALARTGYEPKKGSRLSGVFQSFRAGFEAFRSRRMWFITFVIAPLPWLWEALVLNQVSSAFGFHIDFAQAFCVLVGFNLAMVVPSPGGLGTVEAGGTAALMLFGVDQSKAFAFMFVYHFAQLLPGIMAGIAILVSEGERLFGGPAPPAAVEAPAPPAPLSTPRP